MARVEKEKDCMNLTIDYHCPECKKDVEFEVEADSPSDYYCEDSCPECGAALDLKFYDSIPERIADEYTGRAEYLQDR